MTLVNPFNVTQIDTLFLTLGQSEMPWGIEWSIFIVVIFAWAYISLRGGFEKSLLSGFFLFIIGFLLQYFLIGYGTPLAIMAILSVFIIVIYLVYVQKLI